MQKLEDVDFIYCKVGGGKFKVKDSRKCNTNTDESYYLTFIFVLPFLDSDNVIDCFTDDFLAILPAKDNRVVQFTDYVFENITNLT